MRQPFKKNFSSRLAHDQPDFQFRKLGTLISNSENSFFFHPILVASQAKYWFDGTTALREELV